MTALEGERQALRWSSVRDCPRKAIYEATGAPARERTDRENRILFRGKKMGRDYVEFLAEANRAKAWVASGDQGWLPRRFRAETALDAEIVAELPVPWPLGVLHVDAYLRATRTGIEVLSSAHASEQMVRSKQVQIVGAALHSDLIDNCALVILNPSDFTEERTILLPDTPQWAELEQECHRRIAQVEAWRDNGDMPGRVCTQPTDSWSHFCLHAEHCFDGWTPEPFTEDTNPETLALTANLYAAKELERDAKQLVKTAEADRRSVEAALAERFADGKRQVGPYQLTRARRQTRSFNATLARNDSRFDPALLDEFSKVTEWEQWSVKKAGEAVEQPDYGEVPF